MSEAMEPLTSSARNRTLLVLARVVTWGLMLGLAWSLQIGVLFNPVAATSEVTAAQVEILKWWAVASWGLASACFSFFRTLDGQQEIQKVIRMAGMHLLVAAVMVIMALVWGLALDSTNNLDELTGAKPDLISKLPMFPIVLAALAAFINTVNGIGALVEGAFVLLAQDYSNSNK